MNLKRQGCSEEQDVPAFSFLQEKPVERRRRKRGKMDGGSQEG